jgi:hypothetical protein
MYWFRWIYIALLFEEEYIFFLFNLDLEDKDRILTMKPLSGKRGPNAAVKSSMFIRVEFFSSNLK